MQCLFMGVFDNALVNDMGDHGLMLEGGIL